MADKQEIWEKHPELFHYTDCNGVVGILTSQNLRATHYKFLNDTTEVQLMKAELAKRLFLTVKDGVVKEYLRAGYKKKTAMKKAGGTIHIATQLSTHLADTFSRLAFEDTPTARALAIPYMTSFCAHTSDQPYEQKNGLLSQWRGYGRGHAIVFDTKKLSDLVLAEGEYYYYAGANYMGDVVYQGDEDFFEEEFGDNIENIKSGISEFIESGGMEVGEFFGDVLSIFTRLKHRGFYEEREVRSVTFPMTKEIENEYKKVDPTYVSPSKPMKKIHKREDGASYIEMFDFEGRKPLPIKRIIVGPQKDQGKAKQMLKRVIARRKIEVQCSETPLSGF